jgi:hypothetical protein
MLWALNHLNIWKLYIFTLNVINAKSVLYKVATAQLCLYTILCNVKPEKNMQLLYRIHYSLQSSCPRIIFCTLSEGYVADTCDKFQTNPRCYSSVIFKIYNMWLLITLEPYKLWGIQEIPVIWVFIIHFPAYMGPNYWGTILKDSHFQGPNSWIINFPIENDSYLMHIWHFLPVSGLVEMAPVTRSSSLCLSIGAKIHEPWRMLLNLSYVWFGSHIGRPGLWGRSSVIGLLNISCQK